MTDAWFIKTPDGEYIADLDLCSYGQSARFRSLNVDIARAEADARLIAAAPDLLAGCLTFLKYCKRRDGSLADFEHAMMAFVEDGSALQECIDVISASIAKAKGPGIRQDEEAPR